MIRQHTAAWATAILNFGSSLKLGVWILGGFMLLVFFGTAYQVEHGLHAALDLFFYAWFTPPISQWAAPDSVSIWARIGSWLPLPLPGGWLVMSALFVNLSLNLLRQLSKGWQKGGIILAHVGILLMLAGGWITHHTAQEGFLSLAEGDRSSIAISHSEWELALWSAETAMEKAEYRFPVELLAPGQIISIEELDLILEIEAYYPNTRAHYGPPVPGEPVALNVEGITSIMPEPQRGDPGSYLPAVLINARRGEQSSQRLIFHGSDNMPLVLPLPSSPWYVQLRRRPMPLPVTIQLLEFRKVFEPHTTLPRSFSSRILVDQDGLQREVIVAMNRPFRYGGFTFFQSSYGTAGDGRDVSIFAVSHNRVVWAPYIATGLTGLGLIVQFLIQWVGPGRKRWEVDP